MYAIIQTGGKQYRVAEGDMLTVEKIEVEPGSEMTFDDVLLVATDDNLNVGRPKVEGAIVHAEVVAQDRADKVEIIKFKRRKHQMKHQGHRQYVTKVKITKIQES